MLYAIFDPAKLAFQKIVPFVERLLCEATLPTNNLLNRCWGGLPAESLLGMGGVGKQTPASEHDTAGRRIKHDMFEQIEKQWRCFIRRVVGGSTHGAGACVLRAG